jgi:hypothetical protein
MKKKARDRTCIHNPLCDCLDVNPDGIRKPCNCGAELSVDRKRRIRAFVRLCIRNSGGDPDAVDKEGGKRKEGKEI